MYIQCIYNVYSMYIQCIFNVYSMYIQCIFNVYSMYIQYLIILFLKLKIIIYLLCSYYSGSNIHCL